MIVSVLPASETVGIIKAVLVSKQLIHNTLPIILGAKGAEDYE